MIILIQTFAVGKDFAQALGQDAIEVAQSTGYIAEVRVRQAHRIAIYLAARSCNAENEVIRMGSGPHK